MAGLFRNFTKIFMCMALLPTVSFGNQMPSRVAATRVSGENPDSVPSASIRRAATSVIARSANPNGRKARTVVSARPVTNTSRVATTRNTVLRTPGDINNVSRAATTKNVTVGRSAKTNAPVRSAVKGTTNAARAGTARATAVFSDVNKIGGGYAACRDSYATCMDQFCANANDTYRRCYCSDRFVGFRDTMNSLDAALTMLAEFQNTNLDAVNKTAAEVNAMYTASEGESAIKKDTSASQKLLNNISDILSGKRDYKSVLSSSGTSSVGLLDISGMFSFSDSNDDIFSDSSAFDRTAGASSGTNMSDMEGTELYNAANRQCSAIAKTSCGGDATFNLARSAYSIMIGQDCNLLEKNIDAKKQSVQDTVRTAEKYLRDARLEEYRAHNSQDVNDCLSLVESALRQSTACGADYEKCMDYTGLYINNVTGEPIYSKALFDLNNLIKLDGSGDVLEANKDFDNFLESRKMFAESALDTCRGIADTVWYEFKRSALIQIAQAQDAKIQSVKDSCVDIIKDCYDQQTGALDTLGGKSVATKTGAISAIAARDMCRDQVFACAALYGDVNGCVYDDKNKQIKNASGATCGLESLLAYVNTVDSVRVAQNCENALREYANDMCNDEDEGYPWGCRNTTESQIKNYLNGRAKNVCGVDLVENDTNDELDSKLNASIINTQNIRNTIINDIKSKMNDMMSAKCAKYDGYWFSSYGGNSYASTNSAKKQEFYAAVYNNKSTTNWGVCVENTLMSRCLAQGETYATYDEQTAKCTFKPAWYEYKCESIGGYYTNSKCYLPKSEYDEAYKQQIITNPEPEQELTSLK